MAQIENEYGNVEYAYGAGGARYVAKVADYAVNHPIGAEVPWVMCQQGVIASKGTSPPSNVISACNGYYCDNWIEDHIEAFPDQPHMFTENWPGWFQKVRTGSQTSVRNIAAANFFAVSNVTNIPLNARRSGARPYPTALPPTLPSPSPAGSPRGEAS